MELHLHPRLLAGASGLALLATLFVWPGRTAPRTGAQRVIVIREVKHGISPPLRTMANAPATRWAQAVDDDDEPAAGRAAGDAVARLVDPVRQATAGPALVTLPGMNLVGLGRGFTGPGGSHAIYGVPPDPNSAVGDTQIVETVNLSLAVLDKTTGQPVKGPLFIGELWKNFDSNCTNGASMADPVVLYDKQAARWAIKMGTLGTPYYTCMAVSETSDATGAYYLYDYEFQAEGNLTGQKMATWLDGYYLSTYINVNSVYVGPSACVLDRSQMLIGQAATMQCVQLDNTHLDGMVPSNMDGPTAPPAGSPNYYLLEGPRGTNALLLYLFHVDFVTPANTQLYGPVKIDVAAYTAAGQVPQYGTSQLLHTNSTSMMMPVQYRNFANATPPYETLVTSHCVLTGTGSATGTGMRWYELRSPLTAPVVYQQGTYAPDSNYRWMGSAAMDGLGDIALGYSLSTTTAYPSVLYTGRVPSDPLGTMEAEATIFNGSGNQSDSDRWGDYTSMSVDPSDDCTMWYTGQYLTGTGSNTWATRLFQFQFPGCKQAPAAKRSRAGGAMRRP
jgi:hypothetical protein